MSQPNTRIDPSTRAVAAQEAARELLVESYSRIRAKNPSYSVRAYARQLKLHPSAVSLMMKGKLPITLRTAQKMATHFKIPQEQLELLFGALSNRSTKQKVTLAGVGALRRFERLRQDEFSAIAEGIHFAILSLAEARDFGGTAEWIAASLRTSLSEVRDATTRLVRLGLLSTSPDGTLRPTGRQFETTTDLPDACIRSHHREGLEQALSRLEDTPVEERDFSGITLCIDPSRLPEAKQMIREFRQKLGQFLETGDRTEVYRFTLQLFPYAASLPEEKSHAS